MDLQGSGIEQSGVDSRDVGIKAGQSVPVGCELGEIAKRQASIRLKGSGLIIQYGDVGFVEANVIDLTRYDPPALSETVLNRHSNAGFGQALLVPASENLVGEGCKSTFHCSFPFAG